MTSELGDARATGASLGRAVQDAAVSDILGGPRADVRAARGTRLRTRHWRTEALLRMFENVLEVGENPAELVVYASLGKAARSWPHAKAIVRALLDLEEGETLVLQSGAPVGVIATHAGAPMVVSAVNNTVGRWSGSDRFYERADRGETMWGGLTAAAWQYIGRQGVLQGTYELLRIIAERHLGGATASNLAGRWLLTAGLGGMGSSQPISARMLGLSSITVEVDGDKIRRLVDAGGLDVACERLDDALQQMNAAHQQGRVLAIGLRGNACDVFEALVTRSVTADVVTDQTAAHDARYGYVPSGYTIQRWMAERESEPRAVESAARASIARQVGAMLTMCDRGAIAFENGNNLRVQAIEHLGESASSTIMRIPGFMEAYLRPLFCRGIGPFRWVLLSGDERDLALVDDLVSAMFPARPEVADWITLARRYVPVQGLPARSCWLGHGERSALALAVNALVADATITAPVLFSRDHLDAAGMTNPRIGTEAMRDGSDGVTDWPLLDSMLLAACGADLVAVHSGGGGYSGWMQSAGLSVVADGTVAARDRLKRALDADTGLGVLRHLNAGYGEALEAAERGGETRAVPLAWFDVKKEDQDA